MSPGYSISIALFNNVFLFAKRVYEQKQKQSKALIGVRLFEYMVEMKYNVKPSTFLRGAIFTVYNRTTIKEWLKKRFTKNKCNATLWPSIIFTELQQVRIL